MKAFRSLFLGAILCAAGALTSSTAIAQNAERERPEPQVMLAMEMATPTDVTVTTATASAYFQTREVVEPAVADMLMVKVRAVASEYQLNEAEILQVRAVHRAMLMELIGLPEAEARISEIVAQSRKNAQLRSRQPSDSAPGSSASVARRWLRIAYC